MPTIECAGSTLWYESMGSGELLIALHGGLGLDHTCFRPWLDPLGQHFQLTYLDFRANGRSTGDGVDITMRRLAEDVDALRCHLGHERAWLLGHSYGGFVALEYALAFPQHLAGLVLLDTDSTGPSEQTMVSGLRRLGVEPEEMAAFGQIIESSEDMLRLFDAVGAWYLPHSPPGTARAVMGDVIYRKEGDEGGQRALAGWEVSSRLGEIEAPCLVITGEDDFMFPAERAEQLGDALTHGTVEVVLGSGHLPFVERTDAVLNAILAFVSGAQQSHSQGESGSGS